jgi:hypothetical protein
MAPMFKTGGIICTSSVSIVTDYRLDGQGSVPRRDGSFLYSTSRPPPGLGRPATCPTGYKAPFPRVKRPRCEADHSPPSSTEVKNYEAIPPLLHTSSCCDA